MNRIVTVAIAAAMLVACGTGASSAVRPGDTTAAKPAPPPKHIVVVMEENHSYGDVIGSADAPYLNKLASGGRNLTRMYSITHPSQPNYVALFSGSQHGVTNDTCPQTIDANNLGNQMIKKGYHFVGWSEDLPSAGAKDCYSGSYVRRHAPWVDFTDLPAKKTSKPFSDFPTNYTKLPVLSFVIPNLNHDMHDGTVKQADTWMRNNMSKYARWAKHNDSLLIVTWDEDDRSANNHIPTIIFGAGVTPGTIARHVTLYSLLRLLEDTWSLRHLGGAKDAPVIPLHRS